MYPCGVKVVGDNPTQAEIDVAAYLGVPLIKIHKIREKEFSESLDAKASVDFNFNVGDLDTIDEIFDILGNTNNRFKR